MRNIPTKINAKENKVNMRFGKRWPKLPDKSVVMTYMKEPYDTINPLYCGGTSFSNSKAVTKKLDLN